MKGIFATWKKKLHISDKNFAWQMFQIVRTFLVFTAGSLFFRADSLLDAFHRIGLSTRLEFSHGIFKDFIYLCYSVDLGGKPGLLVAIASFVLIAIVDICIYIKSDRIFDFFEGHRVIRWAGYYALAFLLILSLDIRAQEFLYAQF